ncbi:MAG: hypothetical protein EOO60_09785 [Hymenobacter sp.]|nr:MAG: hypothetical protein EOO60_09785 [Hymenobacter sp.]
MDAIIGLGELVLQHLIQVNIVREHGLSEATFYAWKSKYAGASVTELTRLKHLEEENRKLKQLFADLSLENQAIKEMLRKKRVALRRGARQRRT